MGEEESQEGFVRLNRWRRMSGVICVVEDTFSMF